jgi:deoxyribose-phosphate aldolase
LKPQSTTAIGNHDSMPHHHPRNPGVPLDLTRLEDVRSDPAEVEEHLSKLGRHASRHAWRNPSLLLALRCTDLTTLANDDTPGRVRSLCRRGRRPFARTVEDAFRPPVPLQVAAVCVYPALVKVALAALSGSNIQVAVVAGGFPTPRVPLPRRLAEIRSAVARGADEIDAVVDRNHILAADWNALYEEVSALRDACGPARLKTILGTGALATLTEVARASLVAMAAGSDFIKTSTGKDNVNATLPAGLVMARQIRDYAEATGYRVGIKPSGGLRTAADALGWLALVSREPGEEWLGPELFRIGASTLLTEIEREIASWATT